MPRPGLSTVERGYGGPHQKRRQLLAPFVAAGGTVCSRCGDPIRPGEPWDLGHADGESVGGPEHSRCNRATNGRWSPLPVELEPEREGLSVEDERWDVPWLRQLRDVPADATWPRLMTVPHPAAAGSLGDEFVAWAEAREGLPLRWWQRLAATRLLEVDGAGRLVWEAMVLSMARQLGKSWLLRELCLWRMHQGERFGEPQQIVHTGKDLQVCQEIQLRARVWAKEQGGYKVREVNGQEQITFLQDGSRWMLRAKESAYGLSVSVAAVDEAWKVKPSTLSESVIPTMVEREQPQLWLISTAHRLATVLMLRRRRSALEHLELGDGDLLVEWSAPAGANIAHVNSWRLASPHWTLQRERMIREQLEAMQAGEVYPGAEEDDPEQSFRSQWLNQWPKGVTVPDGEGLLPPGMWSSLHEPGLRSEGPLWVAVEDNYGQGAAIAGAARLEDGRIEVDGWLCEDWDEALEWVRLIGATRTVRSLQVGASMLDRIPSGTVPPPKPAGGAETRPGLAVFRDLAANGMLAHNSAQRDLDEAVSAARVKQGAVGLTLVPVGHRYLVNALVWAVAAAHRPAPVPVVY